MRPTFKDILYTLTALREIAYNLELIVQDNLMEELKSGIQEKAILRTTKDDLQRNLVDYCCIFGNLEMLKYLVSIWGKKCLRSEDSFSFTLTHFAGFFVFKN